MLGATDRQCICLLFIHKCLLTLRQMQSGGHVQSLDHIFCQTHDRWVVFGKSIAVL